MHTMLTTVLFSLTLFRSVYMYKSKSDADMPCLLRPGGTNTPYCSVNTPDKCKGEGSFRDYERMMTKENQPCLDWKNLQDIGFLPSRSGGWPMSPYCIDHDPDDGPPYGPYCYYAVYYTGEDDEDKADDNILRINYDHCYHLCSPQNIADAQRKGPPGGDQQVTLAPMIEANNLTTYLSILLVLLILIGLGIAITLQLRYRKKKKKHKKRKKKGSDDSDILSPAAGSDESHKDGPGSQSEEKPGSNVSAE